MKAAGKDKNEIALNYRKLHQEARVSWQTLRQKPLVLVGTATCGRAAGALQTLRAFQNEIARRNLDARAVEVGCLGHCYAEPLAVIYKEPFPPIVYG
ncbi:MAG: (2Fe-2S) ferredoxin domain-containing protein, partial [Bacillota bacterium]